MVDQEKLGGQAAPLGLTVALGEVPSDNVLGGNYPALSGHL